MIDQIVYRDVLGGRVGTVNAVGPERQRGRLALVGEVSGIVPRDLIARLGSLLT